MNWKQTIDIKNSLEKFDDTNLSTVGLEVVGKLKGSGAFPEKYTSSLMEAVRHEDVDAFDRALMRVYDFADANEIWLGP